MREDPAVTPQERDEACPAEWTLSVYVDAELEAGDARALDLHLVGCRTCRERVVALRDEAAALRAALALEDAVAPAPLPAEPPQGLLFSAGTAATATVVCLTALAWLVAPALPPALAWLNPFDLGSLIGLCFDAVSLVRDRALELYRFALGAAAVLSASLLLTGSLGAVTRRLLPSRGAAALLGALGLSAALPAPAAAVELLFDTESARVPAGEVVEHTWVTTARSVVIDGTLRGDLIAVGDRVVIAGVLDGNLYGGARRVEIEGEVTGSVLALGERVRVAGTIGGNLYAGADQTTLTESARVARDVGAAGDGLSLSGAVGRDLWAYLSWVELRGAVARGVVAYAEHADVLPSARVGDDLHVVHREEPGQIVIDPAATVGGETRVVPESEEPWSRWDRYGSVEFYIFFLLFLAAAFLTGILMFRFAPWLFGSRFRTGSDLLRPLGVGFVTVVATPIAILLVAITVVGIPIALAAAAALAACLYAARILVAGAVGMAILGTPAEGQWREFALPLLVGLALVSVVLEIPYLGGVLGVLTLLVGSGAFVLRVRAQLGGEHRD